ncbi:MAG: aminoacyl-tRNA hydrolase [Anaerolineales bacterium]|nr:aminoacyl-tRNA hydrolase [Anaerolineales bacterium]
MKLFRRKKDQPIKSDDAAQTFLIVGLGNPGKQYRHNRHNIGFMLVDKLAERLGLTFSRVQHKALVTDGRHQGKKIILAKPQTFMNNSGQSVGALVRFYKLPVTNLLVAYDDVDLPFETIRMKPSGGSSGQKGMKSIIQQLSTEEFSRLRLGIDRPPGRMSTPSYVLQNFSKAHAEDLAIFLERAADAALMFITEGIEPAMTRYNRSDQQTVINE